MLATALTMDPGSYQKATVLSRLHGPLCPPAHVHSDFSVNFPQHDQWGRPGWPLCPWPQPRYPPAWSKEKREKPLEGSPAVTMEINIPGDIQTQGYFYI